MYSIQVTTGPELNSCLGIIVSFTNGVGICSYSNSSTHGIEQHIALLGFIRFCAPS